MNPNLGLEEMNKLAWELAISLDLSRRRQLEDVYNSPISYVPVRRRSVVLLSGESVE
jgi:hypothetical protein